MQVEDAVVERRRHRRRRPRRRIGGALLAGEAGDEPGRRSGWGGFVGGLALCLVLALAIAVTAFVAAQRTEDVPPAAGAVAGGARPAPGTTSATGRPTPSAAGSLGPTATGRPAPSAGGPAPAGSARIPARTAAPPARTTVPAPPAPAPAPALAVAATADRRVAAPGELTGVTVRVSSPGGLATGGAVLVTLPAGTAVDTNAAPMSPGCEASSGQSVRCPLPAPLPAGWRGSYRFGLVSTTQPAAGEDRRGTAVVRSGAGDVSTTFAL